MTFSETVYSDTSSLYSDYVNPQRVRLLDLLQMNVRYERCSGCELSTSDGRRVLDFLSDTAFTTPATTIPRLSMRFTMRSVHSEALE